MSQKVAQVFFAHAACLHQARDIMNGYMHLSSTRQGLCVCTYGLPLDTQELAK